MYLVFSDKAQVLEESEKTVRSASATWKLPSVIRQNGRFKRKGDVQFSRTNIYMRDSWTCQYCSKKKSARELTFDHVVPRAQGGKTSWTNIVTACKRCNDVKAARTPAQAGMKLLVEPMKPKWLPQQMVLKVKVIPKEWEPYIDMESYNYWTTIEGEK